jgi:hypothetical protein
MYIQRNLVEALNRLRTKFPILAVTGPRQSGKTTLIRNLFPDYQYVTLENPDIRERALADPNGFLNTWPNKVIFDEVQQAPQLFSYLQAKVDADRQMGQFVLSGSENFQLLQSITQSLAGRVALFKLLPFSFSELETVGLLSDRWQEAAYRGFYPALFDRNIEPTDFYVNYVETYIERDVRRLVNVRDLRQFRLFLKYCAGHIGQMLNLQKIANEVGISQPTAQSWFSVLETSYILFTNPPYYLNFNKRLVKAPRIYFYDTGLACYLLEMTRSADLVNYYQRGAIFENLLVAELCKHQYHHYQKADFYYWRDSNGLEIDLLFEETSSLNVAEIKSAETINSSFFSNMQKFTKIAEGQKVQPFLLYGGSESMEYMGTQVLGWRSVGRFLTKKFN